MYFEPSLLVYLAVFRGDSGVGGADFWLVAGIVRFTALGEATPSTRWWLVARSKWDIWTLISHPLRFE